MITGGIVKEYVVVWLEFEDFTFDAIMATVWTA